MIEASYILWCLLMAKIQFSHAIVDGCFASACFQNFDEAC